MELIELYIQEVTRRLPKKSREDISLEFRSTILDMLPDDYTKQDVQQVLEKLGNPSVLASRYSNRPLHLICPKFYDNYITILKMVLLIVVSVVSILFFIENDSTIFSSEASIIATFFLVLGQLIFELMNAMIQVFFWVTIVFIILDRMVKENDNEPLSISGKNWTPEDLELIHNVPLKKKITNVEIILSSVWTVLWIVLYFNANKLVGVYEGFEFSIPVFN